MSHCRWIFPEPVEDGYVRSMSEAYQLHPVLSALLVRRGFGGPDGCGSFMDPRLASLDDPFLLPNMEATIRRMLVAVDSHERIVLYGDYDVDGITSLTLMTRLLRAAGADVRTFLPRRMGEGYGLSAEGVQRCLDDEHPSLVIALDCGTSSAREIALLMEKGVDVLVIDHHEIKGELPACPLVNPKLGADYHYLCTAGLVFKTCHAFLKQRRLPDFDLREYLDLVALGTVADVVPLVHENRIFVKRGLERMASTRWVGLQALMEVSRTRPPFSPMHVSFQLAPRLNATGRLGTAQESLELLLTDDAEEAHVLAEALDAHNRERRTLEEHTVREAMLKLEDVFDPARDAAIVLGADGWHPGVIGIVSGRFCRDYHRPALVIGFDENGQGKGSGRSITGLSLVDALGECSDLLINFGGHEMAAGLTIRKENFEAFRERFLAYAREHLCGEMLEPKLRLDGELALREVDDDLLNQLTMLQPFGSANHTPVFCSRRVEPVGSGNVLREKHLRLRLKQDDASLFAIWFNGAQEHLPPPPWDIAYVIERNEYRGVVTPQIQIRAVRAACK